MGKTKKSIYNLVFGVGNQLITLIFGLIVPRLFITSFGSEVNGLEGSIAYIYTYIALLESGIGTATIQALYGPVGRDDKASINAILSATNIQYNRVAKIYFLCMIAFAGLFPATISSEINYFTISALVVLSGVGSFISFLTYGKFVLLLQADGRAFFVSCTGLAIYVLRNAIKIGLIYAGASFLQVAIGSSVLSVVTYGIYTFYKRKNYPWLDYSVAPNLKAISQSRNVLVHQIANIVCNSTDVLVLTYVVRDLKLVSVYNIYIMIFDAVKSLILNIFSSVAYIMGQTYQMDAEKYRRYHHYYEVADIATSFAFYSIAFVMMTPFLRVYTAGITDISYIDPYLPLLFASIKILSSAREPAAQLIFYAGHFKATQGRAMIEAAINLVVSIVAAHYIGIYGVLIGTIIALSYRTIDMYLYTSHRFLNRSVWESAKQWLIYIGAFAVVAFVDMHIEIHVETYLAFFVKAFVVGMVLICFYFGITVLFNRDVVIHTFAFAQRKLMRRRAGT